jgi:hypothetical protein
MSTLLHDPPHPPRPRWPLERYADADRFENAAPALLAAGAFTAVACSALWAVPLWVGFLAGAGVVSALTAAAFAVTP